MRDREHKTNITRVLICKACGSEGVIHRVMVSSFYLVDIPVSGMKMLSEGHKKANLDGITCVDKHIKESLIVRAAFSTFTRKQKH